MVLLIIFGVTIGAILGTASACCCGASNLFRCRDRRCDWLRERLKWENIVACAISYDGVAGAWISGGLLWAAYLVGPDTPPRATVPADGIALAVLATGIILLRIL